MEDPQYRKILAENEAGDFIGRSAEIERLVMLASGTGSAVVAGAPGVGLTELLKQTYDRLFSEQTATIPFYFALNPSGETAEQTARRFLHQFLLQTVAFRRRDGAILNWFPDLCELAELSVPADGHWVDRLVSKFGPAQAECDSDGLIKTCLGGPVRATASEARVFVMIDNAEAAAHSDAAARILREIEDIYAGSAVPYVLAGRRRYAFNSLEGERISIEPLAFGDAARVVENCAARYRVKVNDETRDLIANQFGANIEFVRFMFQTAAEKSDHFDSFLEVEKVYAQEIFGGRIRRHYDALIEGITPDETLQKSIISLLDVAVTLGSKQLSVESWLKHLAVGEPAFNKIISLLNIHEFIRLTGTRVEAMDGSQVLIDYVTARFRLEVAGEPRAALFGECVATYLKRAPQIMAAYYRRLVSLGLRELLGAFSLQNVPLALLDYWVYADVYKGLPEDEMTARLDREDDLVQLPQIVYTANAADLYKPIGELAEKERSAVAIGFQEGRYSDEDEVVWVAAELDSKLEAPRELAEFWCDRLEMAALMCNFAHYKIWMIAREGFTPDAMEMLRQRGAYASSRRQVEHLRKFVSVGDLTKTTPASDEYEVIVPMDDESELIAAHALEEIARRHNVSAKAINQIKTALLEASINASEHSLSPDRRIRQKFRVEDDRITITISNRGLRLTDRKTQDKPAPGEPELSQRRGWGLKLIEKLMDEVKIEQTDDGTSISMTKFLPKPAITAVAFPTPENA
jgi:anti-sigma regulatory factor (Ser/Thr protein kinase)